MRGERGGGRATARSPEKGRDGTEAERLLKGCGWLPEVLRCTDLAAIDAQEGAEGQGAPTEGSETNRSEDADLPVFLAADLPGDDASVMAAE